MRAQGTQSPPSSHLRRETLNAVATASMGGKPVAELLAEWVRRKRLPLHRRRC
jgi:hypothetical protein